MLKEPIEVVYSGLDEAIGQPKDIAANLKAADATDFDREMAIPTTRASVSAHSSTSTKNHHQTSTTSASKMLVDSSGVAASASEAAVVNTTPAMVSVSNFAAVEEISQKSDFPQ